ncbi:hypothetical protein ACQW5G_08190 [Fructilactobacillus sp. Tb1]|uniref:hypothetical protein n=1 Tax=Fructilactobacillus sp. Tb1 TaxID=3422304 RepID=UPI003D26E602
MNIEAMCNQTINLYRKLDTKRQLVWKENQHLPAVMVSLNIHLGELAELCGLDDTKIDGITSSTKEERLNAFVVVMRDFILISSICNWNDKLRLSEDETKRLAILNKDDKSQLDTLFLSIQNMLLKAYYEKNDTSFRHAWVLLFKWAETDFGFTDAEIQTAFLEKIEKDLKLI